MLRLFLILLFFIFSTTLFAENYYIDASHGNDLSTGKSVNVPWKTISKVNSSKFNPGDFILFKCGEVWRESLTISSSGNSTLPITIGSYDSGNSPQILGSVNLAKWIPLSNKLWKSYISINPTWVWFLTNTDTICGNHKADTLSLNTIYDFTYNLNYLYIYSDVDPNLNSIQVEAAIRENGIYAYHKDYITISEISFCFTGKSAIYLGPGNNWDISNIIGCYSGDYNTEALGDGILCYGSNNRIHNCIFYENAHAGINMYDVQGNSINNIIENNIIYNSYHNNLDIKTLNVGDVENCIIRYNRIYCTDEFTRSGVNGIFLQGNKNTYVKGISVYYNLVYNQTGSGIHLGVNTDNIEIYNNTVYKTRGDNTSCYYIYNGNGRVFLINNMGINAKSWILRLESITNKIIDFNCWFQEPGQNQFIARIGSSSSYSNWEKYRSEIQFDANSFWGIEPKNISRDSNDFRLSKDSPCKDKGKNVNISSDIEGNPIIDLPDLGAYEISQKQIKVNIKIFLQGPYYNGKMNTCLNDSSLIPLHQPYDLPLWNYSGIESVASIPINVVDWVLVELRKNIQASSTVIRRAAFLNKDGFIVDLDGVSKPVFNDLPNDNYYIVVKHRNHLAVMSGDPVTFFDSVSYDFTTAMSKSYGQNGMTDSGDGRFCLIGGDGSSNGVVNILDYEVTSGNIFKFGYNNGDLDLNGTANILDYHITFKSIFKKSYVPAN